MKRIALAAALSMLGAMASVTIASAPAQAAGSITSCTPWASYSMPGHGGGWCDGTGPDWTYRGLVKCNTGYNYLGISRWAGDRRASAAYCPSGVTAWAGGVRVYYRGVWQFDVTKRT